MQREYKNHLERDSMQREYKNHLDHLEIILLLEVTRSPEVCITGQLGCMTLLLNINIYAEKIHI